MTLASPLSPPRAGLPALFNPRSVAVVGASGNPRSPYARPVSYLIRHRFPGGIFPVNPKYARIDGLTCYPSLREIPTDVDMVLVMTPAARVTDTIGQAAEIGCRAAVVCSSGFAESGPAGRRLQTRLAETSTATGMRIVGPNSQGLVFGPGRLAATFTAGLKGDLPARGAAYIGQSGALGGCVLDHARERGFDLAAWVSTGNQADLDTVEIGAALLADDRIEALMLYLETVPDGRAYHDLAEHAHRAGKPLLVLRSGRSVSGRRANASHTGATLSPDAPFELASARHGVVLTHEPQELLHAAHSAVAFPALGGQRVAVVTTSGGAGAIAADRCERDGLRVPAFSDALRTRLADQLPAFGSAANPVDVTAQVLTGASQIGRICEVIAESDEVDAIVVIVSMVVDEQAQRLATDLVRVSTTLDRPILSVWLAGDRSTARARDLYARVGLPVFGAIRDAVGVLRRLAGRTVDSFSPAPTDGLTAKISRTLARIPGPTVVEGTGLALLDTLGIPRPHGVLVRTPGEAAREARRLGEHVVMKLQSPAILHKTDVRAVRLNVPADEAADVCRELIEIGETTAPGTVLGVLVQAPAPPGPELVLGVVASGHGFPPVLSIGLGGTEAELYADRAQTLLPIRRRDAVRLIGELRCAPVLRGYRGRAAADVDALADLMVRVSAASMALGERLLELEINPVRVAPEGQGVSALDFLLRLRPGRADLDGTPPGGSAR